MTFTIEPMINAGVEKAVIDKVDRWTARTADGMASAQWEHTVLITADGCEVLTKID
jgi:methionyl aminopeptidase